MKTLADILHTLAKAKAFHSKTSKDRFFLEEYANSPYYLNKYLCAPFDKHEPLISLSNCIIIKTPICVQYSLLLSPRIPCSGKPFRYHDQTGLNLYQYH